MLSLPFGLTFRDLYSRAGLARLDEAFLAALQASDAALAAQLTAARAAPDTLTVKAESELLIALAPHLEDFLAELFGIRAEVTALAARHHELAPLYACKRLFVQKKAMHKIKPAEAEGLDGAALAAQLAPLLGGELTELAFARHVMRWLEDETANAAALDLALRYAAWAASTPAGRAQHAGGVLFKAPHKLDHQHLVPLATD